MNRRMVLYTLGTVALLEAVLMAFPMIVSALYREWTDVGIFAVVVFFAAALGFCSRVFIKPKNKVIYAKEGFLIVAATWLTLSLIGAVPFVMGGYIPNYIDAFFETVSGFTTTGASIMPNVEILGYGMQFWRCFTHWIGGMGILVFVVAILPGVSDRSIHILRAEVPGPVMGKLVPRIRDTARILYLIYAAITILVVIMLKIGGMPLYDSILHAFGCAGTGGFGIKGDSIASYSAYSQWVIAVAMMLFGINFNLYYLILARKAKIALKSGELWTYLTIIFVSVSAIAVNTASRYETISENIRTSFFQVSSIITTTGFSTTDFNLWPSFSKTILIVLMFIGGCVGSTAGGIKVSRIMLIFKMFKREIKNMLHPRSVSVVRLEGKKVEEPVLNGICIYALLFFVSFIFCTVIISLQNFDFETNFTAVAACINNIGPGLNGVGPMSNYAAFNNLSTLVLSFAMLFGRLEIFPMLLFFYHKTWSKK